MNNITIYICTLCDFIHSFLTCVCLHASKGAHLKIIFTQLHARQQPRSHPLSILSSLPPQHLKCVRRLHLHI